VIRASHKVDDIITHYHKHTEPDELTKRIEAIEERLEAGK
jgi:hypothetical protein